MNGKRNSCIYFDTNPQLVSTGVHSFILAALPVLRHYCPIYATIKQTFRWRQTVHPRRSTGEPKYYLSLSEIHASCPEERTLLEQTSAPDGFYVLILLPLGRLFNHLP